MKKLNFNSLRAISVPEEWMQNVLKIPQHCERKKRIGSAGVRRIVALAACLVIVGVISVPLYVFRNYDSLLPIVPSSQTATAPNGSSGSDYQTLSPSDNSGFADPTEKVTENSDGENKTDSSEIPTQSYTSTTEFGSTADKDPTEPFTVATNPPAPIRPEPTIPPPTKPINTQDTQPNTGAYVQMVPSCTGTYMPDGMSTDTDSRVYCRLYDNLGNSVGDPNLYSAEHIAKEIYMPNGNIFVSYDPTEKGLKLHKGTYNFCFYTDRGEVVFEGNITVS